MGWVESYDGTEFHAVRELAQDLCSIEGGDEDTCDENVHRPNSVAIDDGSGSSFLICEESKRRNASGTNEIYMCR